MPSVRPYRSPRPPCHACGMVLHWRRATHEPTIPPLHQYPLPPHSETNARQPLHRNVRQKGQRDLPTLSETFSNRKSEIIKQSNQCISSSCAGFLLKSTNAHAQCFELSAQSRSPPALSTQLTALSIQYSALYRQPSAHNHRPTAHKEIAAIQDSHTLNVSSYPLNPHCHPLYPPN